MQVAFLTLGCKVNFYESEQMMKAFLKKGFDIVDFDEPADVYVINTCTVTNIADRKSRQMIHRAMKKSPNALIVAIGCYVEGTDKKEPGILYLNNSDKKSITDIVSDALSEKGEDICCAPRVSDTHKHRTRAFLKVQDGCNQFCSYCLIPYVRGRGALSSTPPEDVIKEVKECVSEGAIEVVINGIHLSSYGVTENRSDGFVREKGVHLADLILRINEVSGLKRIRLGSLEPRIITREWLQMISGCDKLCPHFHLSLQSGCDETLQRMNRHYTTEEYAEKVALLREFYDAPAITTDVIVGFAGETDEEFDKTVSFIDSIGFADLHVFQYSMRDGTRAASMPDQVSPEVKKQRSDRLLKLLPAWQDAYKKSQEDIPSEILFEETACKNDTNYLVGYNERYVRYGVPEDEAKAHGWGPGTLCEVPRAIYF